MSTACVTAEGAIRVALVMSSSGVVTAKPVPNLMFAGAVVIDGRVPLNR